MKTKKQQLLELFERDDIVGIKVLVKIPECPEVETIYNPKANFEYKKVYYAYAYDDNLRLNAVKDIEIVNFVGVGGVIDE